MEFCPSCGSIMLPQTKGSKAVLLCRGCGRTADKFSAEKYKITENVHHKHGDILVVEDDRKKRPERDRRYLVDLYGDGLSEVEE